MRLTDGNTSRRRLSRAVAGRRVTPRAIPSAVQVACGARGCCQTFWTRSERYAGFGVRRVIGKGGGHPIAASTQNKVAKPESLRQRRPPSTSRARQAPINGKNADDMAGLSYTMSVQPGLSRRRVGKGFSYRDPYGARITDPDTLARIRTLAIPPAWTKVWICPDPDGHLQAVGEDDRLPKVLHPPRDHQRLFRRRSVA